MTNFYYSLDLDGVKDSACTSVSPCSVARSQISKHQDSVPPHCCNQLHRSDYLFRDYIVCRRYIPLHTNILTCL